MKPKLKVRNERVILPKEWEAAFERALDNEEAKRWSTCGPATEPPKLKDGESVIICLEMGLALIYSMHGNRLMKFNRLFRVWVIKESYTIGEELWHKLSGSM